MLLRPCIAGLNPSIHSLATHAFATITKKCGLACMCSLQHRRACFTCSSALQYIDNHISHLYSFTLEHHRCSCCFRLCHSVLNVVTWGFGLHFAKHSLADAHVAGRQADPLCLAAFANYSKLCPPGIRNDESDPDAARQCTSLFSQFCNSCSNIDCSAADTVTFDGFLLCTYADTNCELVSGNLGDSSTANDTAPTTDASDGSTATVNGMPNATTAGTAPGPASSADQASNDT